MSTEMNITLAIEYINGNLNEEEKLRFEQWLHDSEENSIQFESFKKYWEISGRAFNDEPVADVDKGWKNVDSRTDRKSAESKKLRLDFLKIAASFLILVGLTYFINSFIRQDNQKEWITYNTNDTKAQVILPDSSIVWLNANSKLKVKSGFNGNFREVILNGEAYFEVRKNPAKPFKVKALETTIEVLGTTFNVNEKSGNVTVALIAGKVAFYNEKSNSKIILLPGRKGIFNKRTNNITSEDIKDYNIVAWKTGKLQFKDANLKEICKALEECYNIKIHIVDIDNPKLSFTGTLDNSSCEEALKTIGLTLGIQFIKKSGNTYRVTY